MQREYIQFYNDYQLNSLSFTISLEKLLFLLQNPRQSMKHVLFFAAQCAIFRFEEVIYSS